MTISVLINKLDKFILILMRFIHYIMTPLPLHSLYYKSPDSGDGT